MDQGNRHNTIRKKTILSKQKKFIFNIILFAFSGVLILLLEIALNLVNYGKDLSVFEKSENYPGYYEINKEVTLRYFSKVGNTSPTSDIFLINKPDTCFRVFVFGGSTTRGFPYQEGTAFPRILYYQLQDAFPEKRIEVVNLSASAINSFSFIDMANEVFEQKPDAILVYGGHNEYYGALGIGSIENGGNVRWIKKIRLKLNNLRTFQLVQNGIIKTQLLFSKSDNAEETLMSKIVKDKEIPFNSDSFQAGVDQFEANLTELIRKAQKHNVPIVLSDLVSNTKDLAPLDFSSKGKSTKANILFEKAKELESANKFVEANSLYLDAKDLDAVRFRAPEALNNVIYNLSKEFNVPVVCMKTTFEESSVHGIIGNNLMIDHLHPNIDGYFLMSNAFFNTIIANDLISQDGKTRDINDIKYYRNHWGFTALDSLIGDLNIKQLKAGWPFSAKNNSRLFIQTYIPESIVDSMAFKYLISKERHIENEHIKLAQYYGNLGLNVMAYKEYLSLIKMHPYITDLYYDASKYLIKQNKNVEAIKIISSAPLMTKDNFYYYMLGTLNLKEGNVEQSILLLNKAYELTDPTANPLKVLMPLYQAYSFKEDIENTERINKIIKHYNPNFNKNIEVGNVIKSETSIDDIYALALRLYKQKNYSKALEFLLVADDFKSSLKIKKLISVICLKQQKDAMAYTYCMEVFDINPNDYENLKNLFLLNIVKRDFVKANEMLMRLESLNYDIKKWNQLKALYNEKAGENGLDLI